MKKNIRKISDDQVLELLEDAEIIEETKNEVTPASITIRPKVPLSQWFSAKVKEGKLRIHQEHALKVFMKKHGLSDIEHPDVYEEKLKSF